MKLTTRAVWVLIAALALGGLWATAGAHGAMGSEIAYQALRGGGPVDTRGLAGVVEADGVVRQPRQTPTPGGPTATPTQVPVVPPTLTPTPIRPDRKPGSVVAPKMNPNFIQPTGPVTKIDTELVVAPQPGVPVTKVDNELVLVPEHIRPGTHTLRLDASATKSLVQMSREGPCPPYGIQSEELLVGWHQLEVECFPFEGSLVQVAQTAVNVDFTKLDEVAGLQLRRAVLHHDESPIRWTDGEGNPRTMAGCVAALGIATSDWEDGFHGDLFPNTSFLNVTPASAKEWDVTGPFEKQLNRAAPRLGFVLRGSLEQLDGDDSTSCLSSVSNIRLLVTYEVSESTTPPSMPR